MDTDQNNRHESSVTISEAAGLLNRSRNWVYDQLITRSLDEIPGTRPTRITVASILEYKRRKREYDLTRAAKGRPSGSTVGEYGYEHD